eukprot:TRINITY_DN2375_c0_g2_i1.p1 TRINITY_DN2375_c0_g2~~TRINITY_DN2375_c0_g2_i1.p1  ORF type:complete len:192 (-),score=8.98 TRINITY_DN2375_c0_g2_i1:353-928(-)
MERQQEQKVLFLVLVSLLPVLASATRVVPVSSKRADYQCVYTIYVRTSSVIKGGTDANVNLTLFDAEGNGFAITNLEAWGGLMGDNWDYFERGNLDIFSGLAPCLSSDPCRMVLGMDASGSHSGWYCNYVEVTATGVHQGCSQQSFSVETWLGTDVINPKLTYTVDKCPSSSTADSSSVTPHLLLSSAESS